MKRNIRFFLLFGFSGAFFGCSGDSSDSPNDVTMHLSSTGGKLVVDSCTCCTSGWEKESFPNPANVKEMTVNVDSQKNVKVDCHGASDDACDSPVIAKINDDKSKVLVLTAAGKKTVAELRNQKKPSGGRAIDRGIGNPFSFPNGDGNGKSGSGSGTPGSDGNPSSDGSDGSSTSGGSDGNATSGGTKGSTNGGNITDKISCVVAKGTDGKVDKLEKACDVPEPKSCQDVYRLWCTYVNARLAQKGVTTSSVNCDSPDDALNGDVHFDERDGQPTDRCYNEQITPHIRTLEEVLGFDSDKFDGFSEVTSCKEAMITVVQNVRDALIDANVCTTSSPLVLDLDGDGVRAGRPEQGAPLDLLGDGRNVMTAWPQGNDALLVLDRDGNGVIEGMAELFGTATDRRAWHHGFEPLAELDDNQDGVVNAKDRLFTSLALWRDVNHDGRGTISELVSLAEMGIVSIETRPETVRDSRAKDENGNRMPFRASFVKDNGTRGTVVDLFPRWDEH